MEAVETYKQNGVALQPAEPVITDDKLVSFLDALNLASKLTQGEKTQFLEIAKAYQLNPFTREIYAVKYGDKFSLIVGYEVYLKRAERSGKLSGWATEFKGDGKNLSCQITINRRDWQYPLVHEVYLSEYDQNNTMWRSKPRTMLRKVAVAQGFRMAFPVELGGIPYTSDELPDVQEVKAEVVQKAPKSTQEKLEELRQDVKQIEGKTAPKEDLTRKPEGEDEQFVFDSLDDWYLKLESITSLEDCNKIIEEMAECQMPTPGVKVIFEKLKGIAYQLSGKWDKEKKEFIPE